MHLSVVIVCILASAKVIYGSQAEYKLVNHLFGDYYDKRVRPGKQPNAPLHMHIENIHLKRLTNIDETHGTLDIGLWIGFAWNDTDLSWEPSSYGGVKHIAVRATDIWTPDIMLFSGWGVAEMSMRESHEHDAILMSNGEIFYYPSVKLNLPCLNRTAGELECNFGIGSWALSSDHLDIHLVHKNFDTTKYVMDPHYSVAGDSLEKITLHVPAFDETWELVVARIKLAKNP